MKETDIVVRRYEADEGYVFDWKEPRYTEDEDGNKIQEHLYAKVLFLSLSDSIDNYIEVVKPEEV